MLHGQSVEVKVFSSGKSKKFDIDEDISNELIAEDLAIETEHSKDLTEILRELENYEH
jgi:hypothetical protein